MAVFNTPYGHHGDIPSIEDMICYLRAAFAEAGHTYNYSPSMIRDVPNIVLEDFSEEVADAIITAIRQGTKFIVVATEFMTNGTFNNFAAQQNDKSWYSNRPAWAERYRNFLRVAEACQHVWCLLPEQLEQYAEVLPRTWLHLLPFGYVEGYATADVRPYEERDLDFIFTGTMTTRREAILATLQSSGARTFHFKPLTPAFIRDNVMSRARMALGIKQYDGWKYPSLLREYHHLMNRSFILAEACEQPNLLDPYILRAPAENFAEFCLETLKRDDLGTVADQNLERFRDELPLKSIFADFLEASLT